MAREYRCYGPPGTGKTSWLSRVIENRAKEYGSDKVVVTSFTRAAAVELMGRDLPVPRDKVGTLHALCYRMMGKPTIAETQLKEWNEHCAWYHALSGNKANIDEPAEYEGKSRGDEALRQCQVLRARMIPPDAWPTTAQSFYKQWREWKGEAGYIDFTDMIEFGLAEMDAAPGRPDFLCSDESQDFTRLELSLLRKWGEQAKDFVVVGDEDQCLYHFKGSDPVAFLNPPLADDRKTFLRNSYRVPRKVYELSQKWVRQLGVREDKPYNPRDADGAMEYRADVQWKNPESIVRALERTEGTTMVLTSCGYMLKPLLRLMRESGMLYHNPYRKSRGDWNPRLKADLLLSYLRPEKGVWGSEARLWTYEDLQGWVPLVRAKGVLKHGAKKWVKEHEGTLTVMDMLEHIFEEQALSAAFDTDLNWLEKNLLKPSPYTFTVYRVQGADGLREAPRTTVGTIHSVKGGESDNVFLFPDLSMKAMKMWVSNQRDALIRQFYVGMTRARENLVLCGPSASLNIELR